MLAIAYSHLAKMERTIAFLDGFSAVGGDARTFSFEAPPPDSAGGQDDGIAANGGLDTIGGLGDLASQSGQSQLYVADQ